MPITTSDPAGPQTAGNSLIGVTSAIADIKAPKVSELDAGIRFECAIEKFGVTISTKTTARQKLCDVIATKKLGASEYDDITISFTLEDPQGASQPLLDKFAQGATVYLFHRPGLAHGSTIAAAQKMQVIKAIVATRYLNEVSTTEGEEYEVTATLMPQDATDIFGTVAA